MKQSVEAVTCFRWSYYTNIRRESLVGLVYRIRVSEMVWRGIFRSRTTLLRISEFN